MDNFGLTFNRPIFLLLLAAIPLVWWMGRKSVAAMGRMRGMVSFALRAIVLAALVFALAEVQLKKELRSVSVVYLLDQSLSIPAEEREAMFRYVARAVETQRRASRGDRAGVIVFGREAAVEVAPIEDDLSWLNGSELSASHLAEATNLADALKLAQGVLPHDCARRVVIVTDGNENIGLAREIAPRFAADGIGIDVVPIQTTRLDDVAVEKIALPAVVQQGERIAARVVIHNECPEAGDAEGGTVRGVLRVVRRVGAEARTLSEEEVELTPGKNVLPVTHSVDLLPGFCTYEAQFVCRDGTVERTRRNNTATGFADVRGKARVLFIENADCRGEFDHLIERLRRADMLLDVRSSARPFETLAELQQYDTVVLANVPRTSGGDAESMFSGRQIEALVRSTQLGCGLVMLGGPESFGAGGWANTRLEEASPVKFNVKNAKVVPSGALALVIDKSGSMEGQKIAMSRAAALEAVRVLGPRDHVAVVAFDGTPQWVVRMHKIGSTRDDVAHRIGCLGAGGGTVMYPAMEQGFRALQSVEAAVKHMIVLTDGQTQPGSFAGLADRMRQENITVSTVAVGADADRMLLTDVAQRGGGKFYHVLSPKAIPRIFVKEALRVARPLVYEQETGFVPQASFPHEILRGIEGPLPPITGYVLTDVKENPLVEVALRSPRPASAADSALLASWHFGLGRFVVLTTDAGMRWASAWTEWPQYDALFTQMVRWSMRPRGRDGKLILATEAKDGKLRAVVTALDENQEFANFLGMSCNVITPDLETVPVALEQTAPGRYVGELPAELPGNYFLTVSGGSDRTVVRAGVNVPHASEYQDKELNRPLLEELARQTPDGGEPGLMIEDETIHLASAVLPKSDAFRSTLPPAVRLRDAWPLVALLAACLFFVDVLNRRVALDPLAALLPVYDLLRRRTPATAADVRIERLRSRKADVEREIQRRRATVRFEPEEGAPAAVDDSASWLDEESSVLKADSPAPPSLETNEEPRLYTSRLLDAKRRSQEKRFSDGGSESNHL